MKYYKTIQLKNLTYEEAKKKGRFITRPEWDGVHFTNLNGENTILLKTGETLVSDKIYDKDKNDWMVVTVTADALSIIKNNKLL